jgi:purine-nucleoside phosphorylase
MFRLLGGDVVGMSTVSEALAAARLRLEVLALSIVTNVCRLDELAVTDGESVVRAAERAEWKLRTVLRGVLGEHDREWNSHLR